jgi:hypothetical protein
MHPLRIGYEPQSFARTVREITEERSQLHYRVLGRAAMCPWGHFKTED